MKLYKRFITFWMVIFMSISLFGCGGNNGDDAKNTKFSALSYTKPVAISDIVAYGNETSSNGKKNNAPVENGVVLCPFYTLKVNGQEVPVYTTRCTQSPHSFAWIDIEGDPESFALNLELTTEKKYTGVVVLPEKSGFCRQ